MIISYPVAPETALYNTQTICYRFFGTTYLKTTRLSNSHKWPKSTETNVERKRPMRNNINKEQLSCFLNLTLIPVILLIAFETRADQSPYESGSRVDCTAQSSFSSGQGIARGETEATEIAVRNCKGNFNPTEIDERELCEKNVVCVSSFRPLLYQCSTSSQCDRTGYIRNFNVSYSEKSDAVRVVYSLCSHHCNASLCSRNLTCSK